MTLSETLRSEIHKLINSIWSKEELPDQWKESVIVAAQLAASQEGLSSMKLVCVCVVLCYVVLTKFPTVPSEKFKKKC
jgi:hypothetical protein